MSEGAEKVIDPVKCPHCGGELGFAVMSKLMDESRMSFSLHPHPGELLNARSVGGAIEAMDKLLTAIGKDLDAKVAVLIEGLSYNNGSIQIDLLVARHDPGVKQRTEGA
jgi:hypothetical protein